MSNLINTGIETNVSTTKPHKNLTFQDALIAIAVYSAQIDPNEPGQEIKRIEDLAEKNTLFREDPKTLRARINKFVNSMRVGDPLEIVAVAANSLTPEYREIAFKWASELILAEGEPTEEKSKMLDRIKTSLSIKSRVAKSFIAEKTNS
jgi:hypothetical protein